MYIRSSTDLEVKLITEVEYLVGVSGVLEPAQPGLREPLQQAPGHVEPKKVKPTFGGALDIVLIQIIFITVTYIPMYGCMRRD